MKSSRSEETLPMFETVRDEQVGPLFKERLGKIDWSYSKRNEMEQCLLKYYRDYYGASARKAKSEADKEQLRKLKKLQNRHERAGQILHLVIARYFRSARGPSPLDELGMAQWARKLFRADVQLSRDAGSAVASPDGQYPPVQLLEFFHGQKDAEELCAAAEAKLLKALETFVASPHLTKLHAIRGRDDLRVEKKFRLKNFPCRVMGVVDFAARTKEVPGIFDWKLGERSAGEGDSLQLTVYAAWGAQEFECAPEDVRVFKVFLGSDEVTPYHCTPRSVETARRRIAQDAERMLEMDAYGQEGRIRAFTPSVQARVCELCRYLSVCREGKECVHD